MWIQAEEFHCTAGTKLLSIELMIPGDHYYSWGKRITMLRWGQGKNKEKVEKGIVSGPTEIANGLKGDDEIMDGSEVVGRAGGISHILGLKSLHSRDMHHLEKCHHSGR
ncbi:hypothetical protein V6N13_038132 [Hibiscus sabdariffa]